MAAEYPPSFASLLSRFRGALGLTQEELAERADLSARAISDLERGLKIRPRAYTVQQLAAALGLSPADRAAFEQAALDAGTSTRADVGPPEGSFLGAVPPSPLVAREDERERFRTLLQAATEGAGQLLLLHGELGVGKTRLAQELIRDARGRGFLVARGRCYVAEQATAYYPFLVALGGLVAEAPSGVRAEAQRRWARIQQLMGGLSAEDAVADSAVEQQHLHGVVRDLLLLIAQAIPLALLLDDLQWADPLSLKLLHHLAHASRGARILLAGTFRDTRLGEEAPALAQLLQDLARERVMERLAVRRLSLEETTALVAATMGQDAVSEEFAAFVYRRTKGTPRLIDQLVRSLGGRLELQGEIGAGSMGRVFRAHDRMTGTTVAAKLVLARAEIDLEALLRFQQEGAVLSKLDHPHIVRIHDTFAEEHASCIIMELLDGPSLGQLLRAGGPLPLPRAKRLALQVAAALAYAHGQGIVHRDIKPDNIMVLADDQVKVTDFGIARLLRPETSLQTIATTGMRLGTPLYMAPEQIEGKKVDGRTDVYAFGALLFHMVTGRPPFEGSDTLAVAIKHLQEKPPAPSALNPTVPADWDALILKALAKDPARRYQSARELEQAVAALGEKTSHPVHLSSRTRWRAAAVGLVLILVAAVVAVQIYPSIVARPASLGTQLNTYLSALAAHGQLSGTVLVARHGTVVLDKGYGLADRAHGVPNTATTKYPVGTVGATFSVVGLLQQNALQGGTAAPESPICRYLPRCPASWRPITVRMVLQGTSHLPDYQWGQPGNTPQQTVAACQAELVTGYPPSTNNDCDSAVLATILEKATGGARWDDTLVGEIFSRAGMVNSGWMTDALAAGAPGFALDYDGATAVPGHVYDDFFAAYSTAPDLYAYDNALFGGKLLSPRDTAAVLTPRAAVVPADPFVTNLRWGDYWRIGALYGRRIVYTIGNANDFVTVNMRFPDAGVTVIVISNDLQNDTVGVAMHTAALIFGQRLAPPPPIQVSAPAALVGTYRRVFQDADRRAAHDPGLADWVGTIQWMTIRTGWIDFAPPGTPPGTQEYYTATHDGRLTLLGYLPGNQGGFCSVIATETPPTGSYRWARQGKYLIITRTAFDPCLDRGALMAGRWTKVG